MHETHLVTFGDARPAGAPGECFYCQRNVGERHRWECVLVKVKSVYDVILDGVRVGTWTTEDPAHWDYDMRWFHKNESSWCTGNMVESELELFPGVALPGGDDGCLCGRVQLVPIMGEPLDNIPRQP